jgi:long-chain acyl-CoA synthetase
MDPAELLRLVAGERVTHAFLVPAVLMALLAAPGIGDTDLSSLDTIFYGASPIAEDVLARCLEVFGCRFAQVYGMTETTGAIVRLAHEDHDPSGPRRHLLRAAGTPLPGVELRIVDPDSGGDLPPGAVGEIYTRSGFNMLGYWDKPGETATTLTEGGWLRTGDAGYVDEEGYLYLHDRIKDMVVSGGENIYPAEVENVLLAMPEIADAAVIGVPHDTWGETVKAVCVAAPGAEVEQTAVIAFCRERLAHYKCPTSVDVVAALPRNPSGKVLKRDLREPYWRDRERRIH